MMPNTDIKKENVTAGTGTTPTPLATPAPAVSVTTAPKPTMVFTPPHVADNQELLNYLNDAAAANAPETEEERKKREKKERLEGIISGIGDAASAVSNLIFTTKGAPNMYNADNSMSIAAQTRFDKAKTERDQRRDNFLKYSLNIDKILRGNQNWHLQQQKFNEIKAQNQFDNDLAEAKADRERALDDLKEKKLRNEIDESGYKAEKARIDAKYAERLNLAEINSKTGEYPWHDKYGNLHHAHSLSAAAQNARINGTWEEEDETITRERVDEITGEPIRTTETRRGNGYSPKPARGRGY